MSLTHDFFIDETIRCQHTSNPLGNGGIVETSDGKILTLKRSDNVGEFPGHYVFPGGHPEVNSKCQKFFKLSIFSDKFQLKKPNM